MKISKKNILYLLLAAIIINVPLVIAGLISGSQIRADTIGRSNMILTYATANSLRAEDLPYDGSNSIKAQIDTKVSYDTGDFAWSMASSKSGFLICSSTQSIGNTGSGANNTGSTYQDLYNLLWTYVIESATLGDQGYILLTSGGAGTTKGISAAADWTALKRIEINLGSSVPVCVDSGVGIFDTLGEVGGALTVDLQHGHTHGAHTHQTPLQTTSTLARLNMSYNAVFVGSTGRPGYRFIVPTNDIGTNLSCLLTANAGSAADTGANGTTANALSATQSVLQPYDVGNRFIKY